MSSDKLESLSEVWSARYDDRDDEDLACQVWSRRLAMRDEAMANPVKGLAVLDDPKAIDRIHPSAGAADKPNR
jgi:hypothetical protein